LRGASDIAVNFAAFVGYTGRFSVGFKDIGNLKLKFNNFNYLLYISINYPLQIRCRIVRTLCSAQLWIVFLLPAIRSPITSRPGGGPAMMPAFRAKPRKGEGKAERRAGAERAGLALAGMKPYLRLARLRGGERRRRHGDL
jgi:hypothetical protein